ncbi:MAG TPA: tetratricopeptide repeat protein [Nitrospirota bacterium]|nr:tetratricopeptide repeat protein [Nitrospirota bacterium]
MAKIKKRGDAASTQPEQEIMTFARMCSDFIAKYRLQFTVVAAIAATLLVLYAGFTLMKSYQEQQASPLADAAYSYYNPANGAIADYGRALELYRNIQKKYPNAVSGAIAQYYIGNCLVNLGRPEEALKEYDAFIKQYSGRTILAGIVYQRMGYVYEGMGKSDEARKSFEQAESLLGTGVATVELARLYELAGNQPEAEKKYKEVSDKLMGTTWAMEASSKVQKIAPMPAPSSDKGEK